MKKLRLWAIQIDVLPRTPAVVAVHERVGFRVVGRADASVNSPALGATRSSTSGRGDRV